MDVYEIQRWVNGQWVKDGLFKAGQDRGALRSVVSTMKGMQPNVRRRVTEVGR